MDKLDFDSFDEYSSSQESNTSFGSQESVPNTYFGNSNLAYYDQTQFGVNYNANFTQVESLSFQNQNMVAPQMNNSSSIYNPMYYSNSDNLNFNNNYSSYYVSQNGLPIAYQPSSVSTVPFQGNFCQVNGSNFNSQQVYPGLIGELANVAPTTANFRGIVPGNNVQYQNQAVVSAPVYFTNVPNSVQTSSGNMIPSTSAQATIPDKGIQSPPTPTASSSELENKLLQKRERNRIAARKCRDKKFSQIKKYEDDIEAVKAENARHEEDIQKLIHRKNQLRSMFANFCYSQLVVKHSDLEFPTKP